MGSFVEINDTLEITTEQGFPADVFDIGTHRQNPITLDDVKGKIFSFRDKPAPRIYQYDPVRVYLAHNIDGKWLFWGRVFVQSQQISKKLNDDGSWDGSSWATSGTYEVIDVYDPVYQETFTRHEAPLDRNYFIPDPPPAEIDTTDYTDWHVVRTVELDAAAAEVWAVVGGFYTMHTWHPDIAKTEVPSDQTGSEAIRRVLTFPGQPTTTEELVSLDPDDMRYRYRWHAGAWGERVQDYHAELRVFELDDGRSMVQWSSRFRYSEDAITDFYEHGFEALTKRFGGRGA